MADLEQTAIQRLQTAALMSKKLFKGQPLVITYSGGKDSDVLLHLAEKSGIEFEVLHSLTTADAPETVHHVYDAFKRLKLKGVKCTVDKHINPDGSVTTMWNLIPQEMIPPTRLARYCCSQLKEVGGKDRFIATGVRWDESTARKKNRGSLEVLASKKDNSLIMSNDNDEDRMLFENCQLKGKRVVNPIIDWTTDDVLDYCQAEGIALNPLYSCGFNRVGCIGCPMAGRKGREFEFAMFPKYRENYIRAFDRMLIERKRRGKNTQWETGIDVFHWWMEDGVFPGQVTIEELENAVTNNG
jgi:phosphoadenosine phosphosulfate reductase